MKSTVSELQEVYIQKSRLYSRITLESNSVRYFLGQGEAVFQDFTSESKSKCKQPGSRVSILWTVRYHP